MGNYFLAWACLGLFIVDGLFVIIIRIQNAQIKDLQYDVEKALKLLDKTAHNVTRLADITATNFEHFEKLAEEQKNYFKKW